LEDRILVDIWKASLLMFNYILYFRGSPLHFLQLSNMVTTPYLALASNRGIIRNWYNFSTRPTYCLWWLLSFLLYQKLN